MPVIPTPQIATAEELFGWRGDGWGNTTTGVGTFARDKSTRYELRHERLSPDAGETYWAADGVGAKIVERLVSDALRPGHDIELTPRTGKRKRDRDLADQLEGRLIELDTQRAQDGARSAIASLLCEARAIGGAALLPRFEDFTPLEEPLDRARARGKRIQCLTILDARELTPFRWSMGGPQRGVEVWNACERSDGGYVEPFLLVHRSRVLRSHGDVTTSVPRYQPTHPGWPGQSCFVRVVEYLKRYCGSNAAGGALLEDFAQMIYTIEGLSATRGKADLFDVLMKRLQLIELSRSVVRGVALDKGESAQRVTTNLTGFSDVQDQLAIALCSASDYPATVLLGRSPAGLNATGESDLKLYDQRVDGYRGSDVGPVLMGLYRWLLVEAGQDPSAWDLKIHWRDIRQPSIKEKMDARLVRAQIDEIEIRSQITAAGEVAASRHGGDEYSFETVLFDVPEEGDDEVAVVNPAAAQPGTVAGAPAAPTGPEPLNGAQLASYLLVLEGYNKWTITRTQALGMLQEGFLMDAATAALRLGPESERPPQPVEVAPVPTAPPAPVAPKADAERTIGALVAKLAKGGKCASCDATEGLEVDHVEGRDWDPAGLSVKQRAEKYWDEYDRGVKLQALCRSCNAVDGAKNKQKSRG